MAKKGGKQKAGRPEKQSKSSKKRKDSSPDAKESSHNGGGQRGLVNLGNTCFLNSMLQCLSVSRPFCDEMMSMANAKAFPSASLCSSLSSVFSGVRGKDSAKGAVSPKPLLQQLISRFPWYKGGNQQDAHELLRSLLGSITDESTSEEKKKAKAEGKAPPRPAGTPAGCCEKTVWDNFRGQWSVAVLCWGCGKVSVRLDHFLDISLELPNTGEPLGALGVPTSARKAIAGASASSSCSRMSRKKKDKAAAEEEVPAEESEGKGAGNDSREVALREELSSMKKGALRKRAVSLGAEEEKLVEADDADDSKAVLIDLIVSLEVPEGEAPGAQDDAAAEEQPAAPEPSEPEKFQVELCRDQTGDDAPRWGLEWNEKEKANEKLVISCVAQDSVLDKWNLKRAALGEQERIVKNGDRLLSVDEHDTPETMRQALREGLKVCLTLVHEAALEMATGDKATASSSSASGTKSKKERKEKSKKSKKASLSDDEESNDEEDARPKNTAAERESRRQEYCQQAQSCEERLPKDVRELFIPATTFSGEDGKGYELEACFKQFSSVEALEDDFKPSYECSHCSKEDRQKRCFASRRAWLWSPLPRLITVHLKRFHRRGMRFEKSSARVNTPAFLDLGAFVMSDKEHKCLKPHMSSDSVSEKPPNPGTSLQYELYGICVHIGSSMNGGHYIAYINAGNSLDNEDWYKISDSSVSKCTRSAALEAEAYVAFYRRDDVIQAEPAADGDDNDGAAASSGSDGSESA